MKFPTICVRSAVSLPPDLDCYITEYIIRVPSPVPSCDLNQKKYGSYRATC